MFSLRAALLGSEADRRFDALLALAAFCCTFGGYALGAFRVEGGVVLIAGDAALVGVVAATLAGYRGRGFLVGWAVAAAALLGWQADHAFLGLSGRTRLGQLRAFLELDGLAVVAVAALLVGASGYLAGALLRGDLRVLRDGSV